MRNNFSVIILLAASTCIAGEAWVQIEQTRFLDKTSVVRNGKFVRAWVKNTDGRNKSGQKVWEGTLASYDIDCELKTSLNTAYFFLQLDGTRNPATSTTPDVIQPIAPGSFLDSASKIACKKWFEVWK
jgi:hypothetical protein